MRRFFGNMTPCGVIDRVRHFGGMMSAALKRAAADCPENLI